MPPLPPSGPTALVARSVVAVAHSGRLIRNLDQDRLRRVLRTLLRIQVPGTATGPRPGRFSLAALGQLFQTNGDSRAKPPARQSSAPRRTNTRAS